MNIEHVYALTDTYSIRWILRSIIQFWRDWMWSLLGGFFTRTQNWEREKRFQLHKIANMIHTIKNAKWERVEQRFALFQLDSLQYILHRVHTALTLLSLNTCLHVCITFVQMAFSSASLGSMALAYIYVKVNSK